MKWEAEDVSEAKGSLHKQSNDPGTTELRELSLESLETKRKVNGRRWMQNLNGERKEEKIKYQVIPMKHSWQPTLKLEDYLFSSTHQGTDSLSEGSLSQFLVRRTSNIISAKPIWIISGIAGDYPFLCI